MHTRLAYALLVDALGPHLRWLAPPERERLVDSDGQSAQRQDVHARPGDHELARRRQRVHLGRIHLPMK
jgi:hypothetical protein